ncbi:MAG TPA: hypothetical protein VKE27_05510 [Candidatus Dormibacteraeota bacterium]|nr:hypothetical protein [Candidatus Dormibacteraeota bacterium]
MRNLVRSPLAWLVAAEFVVVVALVAVAWNVVASANRPAPPPVAGAELATDDPATDVPQLPQINASSGHGPLPGLAVDPAFWRERLGQLNGDQAFLEQLEWQIVHSAEAAAAQYVETVVLPAIQRAERAGGVALA